MGIINGFKKRIVPEEVSNLHKINKSFIPEKSDFNFSKTVDVDGKELFQSTVARLGWSEADLNQRQNEYTIESRIGYVAMLFTLFLAATNIAEYEYSIFISQAIMTIVFFLIGFTKAFKAWQVEQREFKSFYNFLGDLNGWVR